MSDHRFFCPHCISEVNEFASVCPRCKRKMTPNDGESTPPSHRFNCPHCLSGVNEFATACPHCKREMMPSGEYSGSSGSMEAIDNLGKVIMWSIIFFLVYCGIIEGVFDITSTWPHILGIFGAIALAITFSPRLPTF